MLKLVPITVTMNGREDSVVPYWGLIHWDPITICPITINGPDNALTPGRRQDIIWTNDGLVSIRTLGTNFSEIFNEIHTF